MLLSKILLEDAADVPTIITGKLALKYSGEVAPACAAVAYIKERKGGGDCHFGSTAQFGTRH